MAKSRTQVTLKLLGLLALPVSVVALLFGFGVSVGAKHRLSILRFEKALGFESPLLAELEARGDAPWWKVRNPSVAKAQGDGAKPGAPAPAPTAPTAEPQPTASGSAAPAGSAPSQPTVAAATPTPTPRPSEGPPTNVVPAAPPTTTTATGVSEPPAADGTPTNAAVAGTPPVSNTNPAVVPAGPLEPSLVITTDPVPEAFAEALSRIRIVRVKVLVEDGYREAHPGWMDDMQRLVGDASAVYEAHFGLRFELVAISRWEVGDSKRSSDTMLADLRDEAREGADVLVGVTGQALEDGEVDGKAEAPTARHEVNGANLVLYSSGADGRPRLRSFLHELGHLHGADDMLDQSSEAWRRASWMSYAPASEDTAPWIDRDSRATILGRKFLPYAVMPLRDEATRGGVR